MGHKSFWNITYDWFVFLDHRYCIEVTPSSNKGNKISILKNNEVVSTTPGFDDFNEAHRTCFDSFLPSHNVIELRNGGKDGVRISLKLINNGIATQLFFGPNADLTSVAIDGNKHECNDQKEVTSAIKIYDGRIIESECIGSFTFIIFVRLFDRLS